MWKWIGSSEHSMDVDEQRLNYFITENNFAKLELTDEDREKLEKILESKKLKDKQIADIYLSEHDIRYEHHWNW
jgi:hypothetical protein